MKPGICTTLDIIGVVALVGSICAAIVGIGAATGTGSVEPMPIDYWAAVGAGALGGILLLAMSAGIRILARIEAAIEHRLDGETSAR